jgi:simple sugar transport system permease protein
MIHAGVLFPVVIAAVLGFLLNRSKWGFEVRMIGANQDAARTIGMPIARNILLLMVVGGAIAGVAGMIEVSTTFGRLRQGISPGYGFMGVVIAALAGTSLAGTLLVAVLFGGFVVGGLALQVEGVPQAFVLLVQGIILFCALAGSRLARGSWSPRRLRAVPLAKGRPSSP